MHLINIYGSNATGKSTRVFYLYKYLESKYKKEPIYFEIKNKSKDTYEHGQCGYVFENGWALFGKETKDGNKWVGVDTAMLPTHEDRFKFFREVQEYNKNCPYKIEHMIFEGYFNSRGPRFHPESFRKECPNLSGCDFIVLYYDTIEQFIERTNSRAGHVKGMDWAENSAGWRDNQDRENMFTNASENNPMNDVVLRLDINEPKDWFVRNYFNDSFELKEQEVQVRPKLF
jgi:hypothetical protein